MDEDSPKYGSNPYPVQVRVNIFNTFTLRHITISLFSVSNLNYPLTLRTNQMQQGSSLPTQAMFHGRREAMQWRWKWNNIRITSQPLGNSDCKSWASQPLGDSYWKSWALETASVEIITAKTVPKHKPSANAKEHRQRHVSFFQAS